MIRESVPEKCQQKSKATEALFPFKKEFLPIASDVCAVFVNRKKVVDEERKAFGKTEY
jgi:hypothetical protein